MKKLLIVLGMVILLDPIEGLAQTVDLELFTTMTNNTYDDLGRAVSSAGDINNDGYDDVLVGAPVLGRVYIYFGGPAMDNIADVVFREQTNFEAFGYSVSAGDVNGDTIPDIIVGAPYNDVVDTSVGRAYIFFGGFPMDTAVDIVLTGEAKWDRLGESVAFCGDVNGDGFGDVIVGAPLSDSGGLDCGRAYIYFGGAPMDTIPDVILTGEASNDHFGFPVSWAGDVNGDGFSDVIVGAPYNDAGGSNAGRAYIYFGGASMDDTADVVFTGKTAGEFLGGSLSGGGDVNGDDTSDVMVGALSGRVAIYHGGSPMDTFSDFSIFGAGFGGHISFAGDVDGDSITDVLVSAELGTDRIYLYLGGSPMDTIADDTLQPPGSSFNYPLSSAGDVNGDNLSDVIVGGPDSDPYWDQAFVYVARVTGINEGNAKLEMTNVKLFQNQPNPFTSSTGIRYQLSSNQFTTMKIYDVAGRLVKVLVNGKKESGDYTVTWDGRTSIGEKVPSGTYIYEIVVGEKDSKVRRTRKMKILN